MSIDPLRAALQVIAIKTADDGCSGYTLADEINGIAAAALASTAEQPQPDPIADHIKASGGDNPLIVYDYCMPGQERMQRYMQAWSINWSDLYAPTERERMAYQAGFMDRAVIAAQDEQARTQGKEP